MSDFDDLDLQSSGGEFLEEPWDPCRSCGRERGTAPTECAECAMEAERSKLCRAGMDCLAGYHQPDDVTALSEAGFVTEHRTELSGTEPWAPGWLVCYAAYLRSIGVPVQDRVATLREAATSQDARDRAFAIMVLSEWL